MLIYVIALSQFASAFMFGGVAVTLPAMGAELAAGGVALGLVDTLYMGASAALLLPAGKLADATDKNTLFKAGLLLFAVSSLAIGFMPSIWAIIGLRLVQGAASALMIATGMAILTEHAAPGRRGQAYGISIGAIYLALGTGPLIAGLITQHFGWRWVYFASFAPLAASYVLVHVFVKGRWRPPSAPLDVLGSAVITASVMALIFGSAFLSLSPFGYALIALGLALGIAFFALAERSANPLIDLREVRANRTFTNALMVQFLLYSAALSTSFLFSIYLQAVRGFGAETAGLMLVVGPALMALIAPVSGRLADRYPPDLLAGSGVCCVFASTVLATRIEADTGLAYVLAVLIAQGVGYALFSSPNMAIVMSSVTPDRTGVASALAAKMRSLGMVLSMIVVMVILSFQIGSDAIVDRKGEFVTVMAASYVVFSVLTAIGVWLAFRGRVLGRSGA